MTTSTVGFILAIAGLFVKTIRPSLYHYSEKRSCETQTTGRKMQLAHSAAVLSGDYWFSMYSVYISEP